MNGVLCLFAWVLDSMALATAIGAVPIGPVALDTAAFHLEPEVTSFRIQNEKVDLPLKRDFANAIAWEQKATPV